MVDEIGGVDQAINYVAGQAKLNPGSYEVRIVPPARTLADLFSGGGLSDASPIQPKIEISDTSILKAMPKELCSMVAEQLQILQTAASASGGAGRTVFGQGKNENKFHTFALHSRLVDTIPQPL